MALEKCPNTELFPGPYFATFGVNTNQKTSVFRHFSGIANAFNLMEIDLFILGDTNIFDNGNNSLEKLKDMSKRKTNLGAIPKKCAHICSTLGLTL